MVGALEKRLKGGMREKRGWKAGSGIPKAAGTGRNISSYFAIGMGQRGGNH